MFIAEETLKSLSCKTTWILLFASLSLGGCDQLSKLAPSSDSEFLSNAEGLWALPGDFNFSPDPFARRNTRAIYTTEKTATISLAFQKDNGLLVGFMNEETKQTGHVDGYSLGLSKTKSKKPIMVQPAGKYDKDNKSMSVKLTSFSYSEPDIIKSQINEATSLYEDYDATIQLWKKEAISKYQDVQDEVRREEAIRNQLSYNAKWKAGGDIEVLGHSAKSLSESLHSGERGSKVVTFRNISQDKDRFSLAIIDDSGNIQPLSFIRKLDENEKSQAISFHDTLAQNIEKSSALLTTELAKVEELRLTIAKKVEALRATAPQSSAQQGLATAPQQAPATVPLQAPAAIPQPAPATAPQQTPVAAPKQASTPPPQPAPATVSQQTQAAVPQQAKTSEVDAAPDQGKKTEKAIKKLFKDFLQE